MITEEDIKIINKCENISEDYILNYPKEISNSNLEELKINQMDESRISNIKIKEDFILIISTKISKNSLETKSTYKNININGFDIRIINLNLKNGENSNDKYEININIPLKEAKLLANNSLINKYFFYDFIKIDDNKSYLHIYIFGQLHIYKIYLKDNQLKYNKIELKKFNEKTKVLYLGQYFKNHENILEIALLLKPSNCFLFLEIDTNEKGSKIIEKEYEFKNKNAKNILYKFIRSYCGIFLFTEKETEKKYIIFKDENYDRIQIKKVMIDIADNFNNYFYSASNKLYLISELPPEKSQENNYHYIALGIFQLYYDEENDIYESKIIQKIMIKNEGVVKDYIINVSTLNYISINIGEMLYFVHLDEKSNVDIVNKINLNSKNLQISRIISDKVNNITIILSYINSKLFLSKIYDDKEKTSKGKCIINYDTISKEEEESEEENNENEESDNSEIEEKEKEKEIEKNEIVNNSKDKKDTSNNIISVLNPKVEDYLDKLIKEKIKLINDTKIEEIKIDYMKKYEIIQNDISQQEKENEKLEKYIQTLQEKISELQKKDNNDKNKEDEKENSNDNNIFNKKKNNLYKNDVMNFIQYNNLRQLAQMKMLNQLNLLNPENLFINGQMNLNDPRIFQLLQQNRNMTIQGNNFFKMKNNKKNEMSLNNFNFP